MSKLISLILFFSVSAKATPTFVQGVDNGFVSSTMSSFTQSGPFPSPSATGDTIICFFVDQAHTTGNYITSAVDNAGNVYQKASSQVIQGINSGELWYAVNITGRSSLAVTFTFSMNTTVGPYSNCAEYSGVGPLDAAVSAFVTANGTGLATFSPLTTTTGNDILVALEFPFACCGTGAAGAGFTLRHPSWNSSTEDQLVGAPGVQNGTFNTNDTTAPVAYYFMAFTPACTSPYAPAGAIQYMPVSKSVKYCDGTTWHDTSFTTGTACATAGQIRYSGGVYQYCNASNWINMKGTTLTSCSGTTAGTLQYDSTTLKYKFCDATNWYDMTATTCQFILNSTGSHSWNVPSDFNTAFNKVEVIGGGGGGSTNGATNGAAGGGGGGYSAVSNLALTPSTSVNYFVGSAGAASTAGGDSYFCSSTTSCTTVSDTNVVVGAHGGGGASTTTIGAGGAVVKGTGFSGGSGRTNSTTKGGGGGGAAGPIGAGATSASQTGGTGDASTGGTGGAAGTVGNAGTEWGTAGSGGGGGGGANGGSGGSGGNYGAGGGGAGKSGAAAGTGTQGIIVITYTGTTCT